MSVSHFWIGVAGAAAAGCVAGLAQSGLLHKGAVAVTSAGMKLSDVVSAETQSVVDDANDAVAEARRKNKIDAAVKERLAAEADRIRAEVMAEIDAAGAEA